jgi:enolase
MEKIKALRARQLIDCKCRPMVEVDVITEHGFIGRGSAPTGISVGMYESVVLRDGDQNEYDGLSVHKAVANVNNKVAPLLVGMDVFDQKALDQAMIMLDGTPNKANLGGNAVYSTSIACMRAAAAASGKELYEYLSPTPITSVPIPSFNIVNGGRQGGLIQPFNEFIIMPYKAGSIEKAVEMGVRVYQKLYDVIAKYASQPPRIALSYGYAAPSDDPAEVLELMQRAVEACGYGGKIAFALDCASSEMYDAKSNTYFLGGRRVSADELLDYAKRLTARFPFVFIEDLFDENDWASFSKAVKTLDKTLIIGDDIIATNPEKIKTAYETQAVHGFVLKPNQIGTLSEALDTFDYATGHNMLAIPSGRSGGVIGDVVMDLAVGLHIPFIKNGAPRSGERIDKLNFLMRASDLLGGAQISDISGLIRCG